VQVTGQLLKSLPLYILPSIRMLRRYGDQRFVAAPSLRSATDSLPQNDHAVAEPVLVNPGLLRSGKRLLSLAVQKTERTAGPKMDRNFLS